MKILNVLIVTILFSGCAHDHYFKGCKVAGELGGVDKDTGVKTENAEPLFEGCEKLW